MAEENKNIILVTGQSGISIKSCINKIINNLIQNGIPVREEPLIVEDAMTQEKGEKFIKILGEPPRIQETLWKEAFGNQIIPKIEDAKGKLLFITFHASYYHQRKKEYVSPISFRNLESIKGQAKLLINFIDDCYDIYLRLMDDKQMYSYVRKLDDMKAIFESIANLFSILTWREIETAFSRKISQFLEIPMYVIATKHPIFMISRLITQPRERLKIFYLSHPISSVRKKPFGENSESAFFEELNSYIREILDEKNSCLFIPDTIDEKRIKTNEIGDFVPELSRKWDLPYFKEQMFTPPRLIDLKPLNPKNFDYQKAPAEIQSAISSLLDFLNRKLFSSQINSRDRTLVEQSKNGVIVYRPFWGVKKPGGVEEEIKYNKFLRDSYDEDVKRIIAILSCKEDLGRMNILKFFNSLRENIDKLGEDKKLELTKKEKQWLEEETVISFFSNKDDQESEKEKIKKSIEEILPSSYQFDNSLIEEKATTTLEPGIMLVEHERLEDGWEIIFEKKADDPFLKYIEEGKGDIIINCPENKIINERKIFKSKIFNN